MRRRRLLVLGGALAVTSSAGCLRGSGSTLSLEPVDPVEHYTVSPDELDTRERTAVEETFDGGNYTVRGSSPRPPFHRIEYVELGGVYYRVETEETEPRTLTRHVLRAERANGTAEELDAVEPETYGDDYEIVGRAYRRTFSSRIRDFIVVRSPPNRTKLLPEPEHPHVVFRKGVYRLTVEERELNETGYSVTTEPVARNESAFVRYLDSEEVAVIEDDELTEEQREVLNTAIEEGTYTAPHGGSEARLALVEMLQREGEFEGVIKYEGEYYNWNVAGP